MSTVCIKESSGNVYEFLSSPRQNKSWLLGYNRNPGGLIGIVIMNALPLIGLATNFTFWFGYGYGIFTPAMSLFGLTFCKTHAQQVTNSLIFMVIVVAVAVICWFIGYRIRASYAKKDADDD